jgi:uncharacterized UBP type Zn finger protein
MPDVEELHEVVRNYTNYSVLLQPLVSGIRPHVFRTLIGQNHQEFATKRQQDAQEYLLHVLCLVEVSDKFIGLMLFPHSLLYFLFQYVMA